MTAMWLWLWLCSVSCLPLFACHKKERINCICGARVARNKYPYTTFRKLRSTPKCRRTKTRRKVSFVRACVCMCVLLSFLFWQWFGLWIASRKCTLRRWLGWFVCVVWKLLSQNSGEHLFYKDINFVGLRARALPCAMQYLTPLSRFSQLQLYYTQIQIK